MSKKITKNYKGTAFLAHGCSVFLHICMVLWKKFHGYTKYTRTHVRVYLFIVSANPFLALRHHPFTYPLKLGRKPRKEKDEKVVIV